MTVNTSSVVFDATLRLSVSTGLSISGEIVDIEMGAGAKAQVYADLAHFRTNVTASHESHILKARDDADYPEDCTLPVVESYEFGLGANAGAYVEFDGQSWGPTPNTSMQIFYTTLYSACALAAATPTGLGISLSTAESAGAKRASPPLLAGRDDDASLFLSLTSTPVVYTVTNILCQSPGLRDCPASLQSTIQETKTSMYTASLPSGAEITSLPATVTTGSVLGVQSFGSGANKLAASSGSPKSYVPSPGPTSSDAKNGFDSLSETDKRLVIGLCAGLGGALLVAIVAAFV